MITNIPLTIDNQTIKSVPSVELLRIHLDDKLNFKVHISNICKSATNQLNTLKRLKGYLRYKTITSQNVPSEAQIKNFFIL